MLWSELRKEAILIYNNLFIFMYSNPLAASQRILWLVRGQFSVFINYHSLHSYNSLAWHTLATTTTTKKEWRKKIFWPISTLRRFCKQWISAYWMSAADWTLCTMYVFGFWSRSKWCSCFSQYNTNLIFILFRLVFFLSI